MRKPDHKPVKAGKDIKYIKYIPSEMDPGNVNHRRIIFCAITRCMIDEGCVELAEKGFQMLINELNMKPDEAADVISKIKLSGELKSFVSSFIARYRLQKLLPKEVFLN